MALDTKRVMSIIAKMKNEYPELKDYPLMDELESAVEGEPPQAGGGDTEGSPAEEASESSDEEGAEGDTGDEMAGLSDKPTAPMVMGDMGDGEEEAADDEGARDTTGLFSSFAMSGPRKRMGKDEADSERNAPPKKFSKKPAKK